MSTAYFDVPELEAPLWPLVLPEAPLGLGVVAGLVVLPAPLWPEVLPEGVAPLAASFMHCSFSAPIRCAHFVSLAPAAALPLAPVVVEVLDWPLVLPLAEDGGVVCELVLLLPPAAAEPPVEVDGVVCAPVLPDEVWANEALDSARSAAAVALARTFRFIWMLLSRNDWSEMQRGDTQAPCRSARRACADRSSAA